MTSAATPRLRVLHGPVNLANQPWVLSRFERRCGVDSEVVVAQKPPLGFNADRCLSSAAHKTAWGLLRRACFGLAAPWRYDVLHYYFGRSYLALDDRARQPRLRLDLQLARRLGRKVFMTFQGSDLRGASPERVEQLRRVMVDHCDRVFVLNPDLLRVLPEAIWIPYASVDIDALPWSPPRLSGPIRIVHAASNTVAKGSEHIQQVVERLRRDWPIEFTLVHGVTHREALGQIQQADVFIDQVRIGWYGGQMVEALALGKPAVCYLCEDDLRRVPEPMRRELPMVNASAEQLETRLESLLRRREQWGEESRRARQFVERWHHPSRIAASMVAAYRARDSQYHWPELPEVERCAA